VKKQRIFCPYCAKPVVRRHVEGKERDLCMSCTTVFYENPLPVACALVVNESREVLLVQRKKDPYKGMWCLPIGFAESGEEVKDAALRELEEEAGITGEILRLIDVDTIDNDFYGSLAIVTYEVRATGGVLRPGDDAIDAKYFPIFDLPPLAWSSNEKAVRIYVDLYRDSWAMVDSFKQLFPDLGMDQAMPSGTTSHGMVLSNILIKIIDKDREEITRRWADEVKSAIPSLERHMSMLRGINKVVLQGVKDGLEDKKKHFESRQFIEAGSKMRRLDIPLPDILNALALSRKNIWMHVIRQRILSSPVEIYSTLELNNRIIFLYDKVNYYITEGYMK
jgi:ADP-ribose pyrophosphatase YjhB (NUDIX family)